MNREELGPYRLLEQLGSGGMGNVFLARHRESGDLVALKILPPALAREEGFVLRFQREAEALQKLKNPHVVRLLESGVVDEVYYIAMEYVSGETLAQFLKRERRIGWVQAIELTIQLCSALKTAHDAGIIHRDLKPSNILLTREGQAKLTDFGVAQTYGGEKLTITGGVIGTAEYMSPEQAQGQRATRRSDLYSLGTVLYTMLTGRPPFTGNSQVDVIHKQRYAQFDPASRYVVDLPDWIDAAIGELLAKNPDDRPPDAYVVARRLEDALVRSKREVNDLTTAAELPVIDQTIAVARSDDRTAVRQPAATPSASGPGEPWWQSLGNNTFVLVGLLAILLWVTWQYGLSSTTPEQRVAAIQQLLNEEPSRDWIRARDETLRPLLNADPGRWRESLLPLIQQIDDYELEQAVFPTRRKIGAPALNPEVLRQLQEIRRLRDAGAFTEAQTRSAHLGLLLNDDEAEAAVRRLLDRWNTQMEETRSAQLAAKRTYLRDQRAAALKLMTTSPDAGRRRLQALIALYENDPDVVNEYQELLKAFE